MSGDPNSKPTRWEIKQRTGNIITIPDANIGEYIQRGFITRKTLVRRVGALEFKHAEDTLGGAFSTGGPGGTRGDGDERRSTSRGEKIVLALVAGTMLYFARHWVYDQLPTAMRDAMKSEATILQEREQAVSADAGDFVETWYRFNYTTAVNTLRQRALDPRRRQQWAEATSPDTDVLIGLGSLEGLSGNSPDFQAGLRRIQGVIDRSDVAKIVLGYATAEGKYGLVPDAEAGYRLYKQAADEGHPLAMVLVASCQATGTGTQQDLTAARAGLTAAVQNGCSWARPLLAILPEEEPPPAGEAVIAAMPPAEEPSAAQRQRAREEEEQRRSEAERVARDAERRERLRQWRDRMTVKPEADPDLRPDTALHRLTRQGLAYEWLFTPAADYHIRRRLIRVEFARPGTGDRVTAMIRIYTVDEEGAKIEQQTSFITLGTIDPIIGRIVLRRTHHQAYPEFILTPDGDGGLDIRGTLSIWHGAFTPVEVTSGSYVSAATPSHVH